MASGIKDIVIGVGHLRQQVAFYSANLGLRVLSKGRLPQQLCRELWGVDETLDTVVMGRTDVPSGVRLRLVRTSDIAARPDFDVTPPGPLGLVFAAEDVTRAYYRLSGDGVEFHSSPVTIEEGEVARRAAYGRAYDGEYLVLEQPAGDGTLSPYFGVTEPRQCQLVVRDLAAASTFFDHVLEQRAIGAEQRKGEAWRQAMGLRTGTRATVEQLASNVDEGAHTTLISYSPSVGPDNEVGPPSRGICALRYDCNALDARLELAQTLGARVISPPRNVESPVLGDGWVATLMPPFGVLIELWEPR